MTGPSARSAASRRRLVEAMGLGPSWTLRATSPIADAREALEAQVVDPDARRIGIARLDWEPLRDVVAGCVACGLSRTRTQTVFGVGARRADWLVVGAAPGADEDARGEPFVGQAGRLLDAMLASVGLSRERNVFILNVLKCRTPDHRDPSVDEVASCRPYLERQIALLAPRMILVVGQAAGDALLGVDQPIGRLRGQRHVLDIGGRAIPLVATHHPAALLQSSEDKAEAWADLCLARDVFQSLDTTSP